MTSLNLPKSCELCEHAQWMQLAPNFLDITCPRYPNQDSVELPDAGYCQFYLELPLQKYIHYQDFRSVWDGELDGVI